jgi:hypothetical protein
MSSPVVVSTASDPLRQSVAHVWRALTQGGVAPLHVTKLKRGQVYRLHGVGTGGGNVVAKRRRTEALVTERVVYQQLLRSLPLPSLRCYGLVEDHDGVNGWLFMEDAGDDRCGADDRVGLMEWLGHLHTLASRATRPPALDDRGADHYLSHLRSGRSRIQENVGAPHVLDSDSEVLRRTLEMLNALEDRWQELRSICWPFPPTLVHGDLSENNVRLRRSPSGVQLFAVDWETAGWGSPAPDLGALRHTCGLDGVDLDVYFSTVRGEWKCSRSDIALLAAAGLLFRMVAAIDWASYSLPYPLARKPIRHLQSYVQHGTAALALLGWDTRAAHA